MGEKKFTFIELHLDGETQFGPKAIDDALPFGEKRTAEEFDELDETEEDEEAAAAEDDSGGKGAIGALIALAVLVALGVAARKYVSDDEEEEELPERDEPDVIVN